MMQDVPEPISNLKAQSASCHSSAQTNTAGLPLVAIVGCPNVGKSVLFNALTGAYVTVSNYPGTTVEVVRGKGRFNGKEVGVVDTPGMYQLRPITQEEQVARHILLHEQPVAVIHVIDAKNLARMLPMTLQLIEAGLPIVLDLNLMDEAERLGVQVDSNALAHLLSIPVVPTSLALGRGTPQLKDQISARIGGPIEKQPLTRPPSFIQYPAVIEDALVQIEARLTGSYHITERSIALLLVQNDTDAVALVREQEGRDIEDILKIAESARARFNRPISYIIARQQQEAVQRILPSVLILPERPRARLNERISEMLMHPLFGSIFLLLSLYLLYLFVGVLGAQTLVKFLEDTVFGEHINPWVDNTLAQLIPWSVVRDLIGGPYGIITLGVRYAVAIILPVVGTFFVAFSIIEDSGYLPRLAMLIDRVFKKIGLNGRAVIPIVLGFGCDTMATIVTRTLETRRERLLSTILLSLAIPCSAQLGVMLGLLGNRSDLVTLWAIFLVGIFMLIGLLAAKVMPGERPTFYMELPPLRLPTLGNVLVKTYTRMEWYFREVFPLFIVASVIIWVGRLTGLFDLVVHALVPLVRTLGLPDQSAVAFVFGFFRRDYGAAGLYDLKPVMNGTQLLVAAVTMTLFVPCVAQFSVTLKERGWKTALAISAFIFPFAFAVGALLNWLLNALGVKL